jgi:Kef-type K+ transport system membrane component KefB
MVPRGEVGLIFAQMGLAAGAVSAGEYGALMLMVLVTTFLTPRGLVWLSRRQPRPRGVPLDQPGEGGIDDLVAGTRRPSD